MKVIIVGGVAGGASCAARLRRLDEEAEIVMVERGPYVSYANCGLPYHVGGVIEHESDLLVASEELFRQHFAVDCRTGCEAIGVSAADKTVQLRDVATGEVSTESYDTLVLSPGAASIRPPLPGIDLPGIFPVRTVPDAAEIRRWIERGTSFLAGMGKYSGFQTVRPPMRAVVVGGGFIGLEMAENLTHRGFEVTVVEMADQVLTPLDPEYGRVVAEFLEMHGVTVALDDGVAGFERSDDGTLTVSTQSGARHTADIVILALGVRPETTLARKAGVEIGALGGIRVDEHMRTSDPDIFAVGDAVEVRDFVTGEWSLIALAGPANRQARIAADVIAGRDSHFRGTQGTAVVGLFGCHGRLDRREREDARPPGRHRLREGLHLPELPRGVLPGRQADRDEGTLPEVRRARARRAGGRRGWRGQADQRHRPGDPDGGHRLRPRGVRALLRAALRQRQGPGQLRRDGRGRRASRRHAPDALGRRG